jgi:hypothetical protein
MIIYGVQTGYHEPHSPFWVIAYWVFILKYFEQRFLKNLEKS